MPSYSPVILTRTNSTFEMMERFVSLTKISLPSKLDMNFITTWQLPQILMFLITLNGYPGGVFRTPIAQTSQCVHLNSHPCPAHLHLAVL